EGAGGQYRLATVEVVVEHLSVNGQLAVEPDRDARADHADAEGVPLSDRVVGLDERPLAGVVGVVVPERAGSLRRAVADLARVVGVPHLDLREAPQVDAAVAVVRNHLPVDVELEVGVVLVGRQEYAVAVGDDLARGGIDAPMVIAIGVPLRLPGGELLFRELRFLVRTVVLLAAAPPAEIASVEERREPGGRG